MSMTVKKGDNVVVIAGKDKGKSGKVTEVSPKSNRVLVDGVNIVTKHQKARRQDEKSQIVKKNAPIDASNVMVVCPSCGKATRVAHKVVDGKKVRVCKKCSASLDKAYVKAAKKDAKKEAKKQVAKGANPDLVLRKAPVEEPAKAETKKQSSVKAETKKVEAKTTKKTETKVEEKKVEAKKPAKTAVKAESKPATKSSTTAKTTAKVTTKTASTTQKSKKTTSVKAK